jgi:hypothetical protein
MPLNFNRARPLLQSGDFARLFREEVGWEPAANTLLLRTDGQDFALSAFAEKRGFTAWRCECLDGILPIRATRLKLERKLAETSYEHLLVFATPTRDHQSWMWVRREAGKPLAVRTHEYFRTQPGDSLLQKLDALYISFEDEEAGITVAEMAGRARAAFDVERVTKAFYRDFDVQRKAFVKFIEGIEVVADRDWYASVMLNRLMFVYFIQRKNFLDGDRDYLRHRLARCRQEHGKDKFYSFYRVFLLRLFHEGFGRRRRDRTADLEKLLGQIPYLNGGLFDVHELEKPDRYGETLAIPDQAFARVFDYFDQWQWHLDERPLRKDDEINPDVLGYIFEKYINQKQMGAYYTKEDITDYIGKNTVLPFLFDAARARCKVAFENPGGPTIWDLLRESPDRYIYPAVRHGADKKLPPEITVGLDPNQPSLIERRKPWNKPAPGDYALPTEIWREVVARRQRCEELRRRLAAGEVREVNDFITLNLDLRQFAQDVVQNCEGPDLLMAFWHAITTITVLDPTGGSGAFIFAALNILDPLYEACLDRMEAFLAEWRQSAETLAKAEAHKPKQLHPNYHKKFTEVLAHVDAHPNRRYFVLKSIVLNNLYAVDIMEEATEICKLRLFLKLAAQIEPDPAKDNLGIEPLPDIDFNIRTGNTLVGYATADEVRRCMTTEKSKGTDQMRLGVLGEKDAYASFEDKLQIADAAFRSFREQQTKLGGDVTVEDKATLKARLKALEEELNRNLAGEYGVKVSDKAAYAKWVKSHQPFHWFIQFYGILNSGGFDVIIGNPPYLEISKLRGSYEIRGLETVETGNLYALCSERSLHLLRERGYVSFIVPLSIFSTPNMRPIQRFVRREAEEIWASYYSNRPDQLFEGAQNFLSIFIARKRDAAAAVTTLLHTTKLYRWASEERDKLFQLHSFATVDSALNLPTYAYPKFSNQVETGIARKLFSAGAKLSELCRDTGPNRSWFVYCYGGVYWTKARNFDSPVLKDGATAESTADRPAYTISELDPLTAVCLLNSNLHFWFWANFSDCRNKTYSVMLDIPVVRDRLIAETDLLELGHELMRDYRSNAKRRVRDGKGGKTEFDEFYPKRSKPILDEIDTVLARHYGFTAEELDFIINYDIKYRLGRDDGDEE